MGQNRKGTGRPLVAPVLWLRRTRVGVQMRGWDKVRAAFSLTALAYDLRRVLNIVSFPGLIAVSRGERNGSAHDGRQKAGARADMPSISDRDRPQTGIGPSSPEYQLPAASKQRFRTVWTTCAQSACVGNLLQAAKLTGWHVSD